MKGTMIVKTLNPAKKVYKEFLDEGVHKGNWFVIEPFNGWNGEKFFYLGKTEEGFQLEGEAYIARKQQADGLVREANEEVKEIKYLTYDAQTGEVLPNQESLLKDWFKSRFHNGMIYKY